MPTQDGPSHLVNAKILSELAWSNPRYEEVFEVRAEPIPNWTSHLVLAGLYQIVPPLIAEKILVSLYILGFAGAFRYFLGAFGPRTRPLSWLGLLVVYNRCLWMGFYNYCLSVIFIWLIMGYCLRKRTVFGLLEAVVLSLLFSAAYFTHLAGFLLAVLGALAAAALMGPRRLRRLALTSIAAVPWLLLVIDYFQETGFFQAQADRRLVEQPLALLRGKSVNLKIGQQLLALDEELFGHYTGEAGLGFWLIPFYVLYIGFRIIEFCNQRWRTKPIAKSADVDFQQPLAPGEPFAGCLFPSVMGTVILVLYLTLTNNLPSPGANLPHGGFIKARLAVVLPLLWLACLREPGGWLERTAIRVLAVILLITNVSFATASVAEWNHLLQQYTAGIDAVGGGRRVRALQGDRRNRFPDPLRSAANYYCLDADNIYVDNYEASVPHFPIKFRQNVHVGPSADLLICWKRPPDGPAAEWALLFSRAPLHIYERRPLADDNRK